MHSRILPRHHKKEIIALRYSVVLFLPFFAFINLSAANVFRGTHIKFSKASEWETGTLEKAGLANEKVNRPRSVLNWCETLLSKPSMITSQLSLLVMGRNNSVLATTLFWLALGFNANGLIKSCRAVLACCPHTSPRGIRSLVVQRFDCAGTGEEAVCVVKLLVSYLLMKALSSVLAVKATIFY